MPAADTVSPPTESRNTRLGVMEAQLIRIEKDIAADRAEHKQDNKDILTRLSKNERVIYMGMGGIGVLQIVIQIIVAMYRK